MLATFGTAFENKLHLTIRLNAMLQAEKFPASVADLHACLANMDTNCLTHSYVGRGKREGYHRKGAAVTMFGSLKYQIANGN